MQHHSVKSFCQKHGAFTEASIRWTLFKHGPELQKKGAIYHLGRKVVIVEDPFLEVLRSASCREAA